MAAPINNRACTKSTEENTQKNCIHGYRTFYEIPKNVPLGQKNSYDNRKSDTKSLLKYIDENVLGNNTSFAGPFGQRTVTYCDYTASGRSLKFIEDYIREQVLPVYGNTHTTTTVTSLQTTLFRHEGRDIIRNAVKASEHDAVIFVGNGCTAAVHKLLNALNLSTPPVVFVGPFEHHSTFLPWREIGAKVVRISQDSQGGVNMNHLEEELKKWKSTGKQLIGCFSAASNITGIEVDTESITTCLHHHDALAFWDYATAGPYVKIDMNPVTSNPGLAYKDAIFLSPHKFVGGVETPGILIAKKRLFRNPVPTDGGGGGSVFFVTRESHRYLQQVEMREEGGTPSIVGAIRAGMVFQLKEAVGADVITQKEHQLSKRALAAWKTCKNLVLLGNKSCTRLPIFSFLIRHPTTRQFLHHNFICAVLNDVFGIQARGGCACAGPYAQDLLGIDEKLAKEIESLLLEDSRLDRTHLRRYQEYSEREILRPGFSRINLPYFMSDAAVDFVVSAVAMVADEGWKLLPQYMFNPETGEWKQRNHQVFRDRRWLGSISYSSGKLTYPNLPAPKNKGRSPEDYEDCLNLANEIFNTAVNIDLPDQTLLFDKRAESLRWFMLPSEAMQIQRDPSSSTVKALPFRPPNDSDSDTAPQEVKEEGAEVAMDSPVIGRQLSSEDLSLDVDVATEKEVGKVTRTSPDDVSIQNQTGECLPCQTHMNLNIIENSNAMCFFKSVNQEFYEDHVAAAGDGSPEHTDTEHKSSEMAAPEFKGDLKKDLKSLEDKPNDYLDSVSSERLTKLTENQEIKNSTSPNPGYEGTFPSCPIVKRKPRKSQQKPQKQNTKMKKRLDGKSRFYPPPKCIFKPTIEALEEYNMILQGDKVLVCLSGGKDSLSLLHTLKQYQYYAKKKDIEFLLGAVTVDPQTSTYDPSPLKGYLAELGVPYFYEEQCIMEQAAALPECTSICSFCSRMKRGRIYAAARREGFNVLAMGQHLDDLAESFFMSIFHNGLMRTMKANYVVKEGDLRVVRPFVYVREKDLREFAKEMCLPVISENCPACFEAPKERHRTKQLLATQELLFPRLYQSLATAMKPLMAKTRTGMESTRKNIDDNNINREDEVEEDDL
ncbi:uncharacterized protein LOC117111409 [Anneissia japonica]|uniref:uncharacterized protein LOC117111409 n=1 Tax=Anneissia japonica TaxID=1529436 RepID=UPI0014254E0A|nr:uncharacterized protein LOC117111409 [Anneissia japonica]